MKETAGYIESSGGTPLYAVYHAPAGGAPSPRCPVLIVPSLFEERKSAYASLAGLARHLAACGHPALRFDFRGSGESGGEAAARRWMHLGEDLTLAAAQLKTCSGREELALVGLRLGATLCLREAGRLKPGRIAALAPVAKGRAQTRLWRVRSKMRAELTAGEGASGRALRPGEGEVLDLDGFEVSAAFLQDLENIDLLQDPPALPCPLRLVQISFRESPARETLRLQEALGASAELTCLRLEPFWERLDGVDTRPLQAAVAEALTA